MSSRSTAHLYQDVTRAAGLGLGINLLLGIGKLAAGIAGHSFALIADAVNSLGDALTSVVILFALRIAQKPPDARHPYGHTRAEGIAATNVAVLLILSALAVGWEALQQLGEAQPIPLNWTIWVAATNVVIKEVLFQYHARVGRRTGSAAMIASAWDHRSDAFSSGAVLAGLAAVRFGGERFAWADEAASIVVSAVIIWTGVKLFRQSGVELMDAQADSEMIRQIRQIALAVPGVKEVETLWVRKSGLEYFADIHIEVDGGMSVAEGHQIGHRVKDQLLERFPALRDVLVHLEPHPHHQDDER